MNTVFSQINIFALSILFARKMLTKCNDIKKFLLSGAKNYIKV
jgi:hypothetical protein